MPQRRSPCCKTPPPPLLRSSTPPPLSSPPTHTTHQKKGLVGVARSSYVTRLATRAVHTCCGGGRGEGCAH